MGSLLDHPNEKCLGSLIDRRLCPQLDHRHSEGKTSNCSISFGYPILLSYQHPSRAGCLESYFVP